MPDKSNNYFSNIAEKLVSEIPSTNKSPENYLRNRNPKSFFLSNVEANEIEAVISELKDNGCGIFKFSTRVLNEVKPIISSSLSIIINLCATQGYFPTQLKKGCITPVYKKGDKAEINNYRPVCSLSPLSKIIEKVIYNRMVKFIDINNIFSDSQFGFRKKLSTETALIYSIDFVHDGLTKKQFVGSIFMDLSKAFDVMSHSILKVKLEHYGFRGDFLNFLMSFLENREYFVNINGFNSSSKIVNIGVPQGSTLGPLLFLLYVNDMRFCSTLLKFIQFADDTTILMRYRDFQQLKIALKTETEKVIEWLTTNKLVINLSKTHSMLFTFKRGNYSLDMKIGNNILEEKSETLFLGIVIDNKLNWKPHITHLCNKISKIIALLRFLRSSFPKRILKTLYMSLIHSYVNYCNIIWGAAEKGNLKPIHILQKKAVRIISKSSYLHESIPLFQSLEILTVYQVYILNCSQFIHKCIHQNIFAQFKQRIIQTSSVHSHNTRNGNLFRVKCRARLQLCNRSFLYKGIAIWNKLDENIVKYVNIFTFKKYIKKFLISNPDFVNKLEENRV